MDGSVRKSYYKRVRSTITLDKNGGTFANLTGNYTVEGKFGATVDYDIPDLTRTGYVQSTTPWSPALPTTFPSSDTTSTAQWIAVTDEIYLENINDENYATATSVPDEGFTLDHQDMDGSVRKSYYKRARTTITLDRNGGTFADLTGNYTVEGKFGATVEYVIPDLTRTDYVQSTTPWSPALPATFPAESATYTAQWVAITYEYYLENINDANYAKADSAPSAGFTLDHQSLEGSVRKYYYKRNTTTITLDANGGTFADLTGNYTVEGKFGATVEYDIPDLTRTDYVQSAASPWSPSLPATFPAESATYTAQWVAITNEYYLEKVDGTGYTKADAAPTDAGFTLDQTNLDGSVRKHYYKRVTTTITLDANGGTFSGGSVNYTASGKYGASLPDIPALTRTDYVQSAASPWSPSLPATFPAESGTYTAQWVAITDEIYLENADNDNYTTATSAPTEGFTFDHQDLDGSVRKSYYKRVTTTITLDANGGAFNGITGNYSVSGKFGATVTYSIPTLTRTDYVQSTATPWSPALPTTFPSSNTTSTAQWIAVTDEIYLENINDENYATATSVPDEGFTLDHQDMDGSVRKSYYKRARTTITLDRNGGTFSGITGNYSVSGKYGASVTYAIPGITRTDYTLDSTTPWGVAALPTTFPTESVTYTAKWMTTASVDTPEHAVSDVTISYDSSANTLTATLPFGTAKDWTFSWYDNMGSTAIASTQTLSLAGLGKGKHTIVLVAVYNGETYTKTFETTVTV